MQGEGPTSLKPLHPLHGPLSQGGPAGHTHTHTALIITGLRISAEHTESEDFFSLQTEFITLSLSSVALWVERHPMMHVSLTNLRTK